MQTDCLEQHSIVQIFSWACRNIIDGICPAKAEACPFPQDKPCATVTPSDWDEVLREKSDGD